MERYWMAKQALLDIPVIEGALPPDTFTQVVLYEDAQRALDAEREKVAKLERVTQDDVDTIAAVSKHASIAKQEAVDAQTALAQLQALGRALIYSDNAPEHDRAWFALRATLDATTPAGGGNDRNYRK